MEDLVKLLPPLIPGAVTLILTFINRDPFQTQQWPPQAIAFFTVFQLAFWWVVFLVTAAVAPYLLCSWWLMILFFVLSAVLSIVGVVACNQRVGDQDSRLRRSLLVLFFVVQALFVSGFELFHRAQDMVVFSFKPRPESIVLLDQAKEEASRRYEKPRILAISKTKWNEDVGHFNLKLEGRSERMHPKQRLEALLPTSGIYSCARVDLESEFGVGTKEVNQ